MNERQSVSLAAAYLLHARPFRDSSVIAEFFTRDYGRVSLVGRGARRPKSRLKGQLRPFQRSVISWVSRGSLGTLTAIEADTTMTTPLPRSILSAYYVNELIMRALRPGDSQGDVFARYERLLVELNHANDAVALRLFERDLLDHLGYGLQLTETRSGAPIEPDTNYIYDVTEGAWEGGGSDAIRGASLLALAEGALQTVPQLNDAKRLLRRALDAHLGEADSRVRQVLVSMQSRRRRWSEDSDLSPTKQETDS
ncbi:MAG: DNA repair protein RecO [Pseudomonadota bacterium]